MRWFLIDLLASFAELLGQSYPDEVDSQNTLPAFLGKDKKGRKELVIEGMFNYAFRQGDWALLPPNPRVEGDGYKLFNLKKDIGQQKDVSKENPKKLDAMVKRFEYLKTHTNKVTKH